MARYIDADALIHELSTMYKQPTSTEDFMTVGYDKAIADTVVTTHAQPTADVDEIVRCKDCKRYERNGDKPHGNCSYHLSLAYDNDFCSWGERGEDD